MGGLQTTDERHGEQLNYIELSLRPDADFLQWLHYLSLKLLHSKRLRPPASSRKSVAPTTSPTFTERECYQCLVETEEMLGRCLAACKSPLVGRKGRRKTQASVKVTGGVSPEPRSAADVLQFAIDRGWVR